MADVACFLESSGGEYPFDRSSIAPYQSRDRARCGWLTLPAFSNPAAVNTRLTGPRSRPISLAIAPGADG